MPFGLRPGMSRAEALPIAQEAAGRDIIPTKSDSENFDFANVRVADLPATLNLHFFGDELLSASVLFYTSEPENVRHVQSLLVAKYGEPKKTSIGGVVTWYVGGSSGIAVIASIVRGDLSVMYLDKGTTWRKHQVYEQNRVDRNAVSQKELAAKTGL